MIGGVLVVRPGHGRDRLGSPRRAVGFAPGLVAQAAGAAAVAVAGFWALGAGTGRRELHERVRARVWGSTALSGFFLGTLGAGRGAGARLLAAIPRARPRAAVLVAVAHGRVRARARARRLCARDPLTFLLGLGADDAAAGGVILVARGADRATRRTSSPTSWSPTSAARARGSRFCCSRTPARSATRRDRARLGAADRDRARGAGRDGDEGGGRCRCTSGCRGRIRSRRRRCRR